MSAYVAEGVITYVKKDQYAFASIPNMGDVFCHFSKMTGTPRKGDKVFVFPETNYTTGKISSKWTIVQKELIGKVLIGENKLPKGHYARLERDLRYVRVYYEINTKEVYSLMPDCISRLSDHYFYNRDNLTVGDTKKWVSPRGRMYEITLLNGEYVLADNFSKTISSFEEEERTWLAAEAAKKAAEEKQRKEEEERVNSLPSDIFVHVYWAVQDAQEMDGIRASCHTKENPEKIYETDEEYYYEKDESPEVIDFLSECEWKINNNNFLKKAIVEDKVVEFIYHEQEE